MGLLALLLLLLIALCAKGMYDSLPNREVKINPNQYELKGLEGIVEHKYDNKNGIYKSITYNVHLLKGDFRMTLLDDNNNIVYASNWFSEINQNKENQGFWMAGPNKMENSTLIPMGNYTIRFEGKSGAEGSVDIKWKR